MANVNNTEINNNGQSFEDLFQNFIIKKYGANFVKYSLFLNSAVLIFLLTIGILFYTLQKKEINNKGSGGDENSYPTRYKK